MFCFWALAKTLTEYLPREQIIPIARAFLFAADAHEAQRRSSGEPYITHPMAVATILAEMRLDPDSIMAAILHDTIEDCDVTQEDIAERFGPKVGELVEGVTKLTQIHFSNKAEMQAQSFRKMILAMTKDIRVIIIKMADRLHNMSTLASLKLEKRQRIATETLEVYAPLANRLGMNQFKRDFEDLGLKAMHPMRYRVLETRIKTATSHREKLMHKIESVLNDRLADEGVWPERVAGRQKRVFSIYKKMKNKRLPFSEIMDVYAFRIIARDRRQCYSLLGVVHEIFTPVPGRFKDYIAIPKANGYQSLHTILFGPNGVPLEIQIRTQEMDETSEQGIAAHWAYKNEARVSPTEVKARAWLKNLLDMQEETSNSAEFLENVKIDLFPDEVYVFTPRGDIRELPLNATAIDFAYMIHTDLGNRCVAAKVNRRLVPLNQVLQNGQAVEIMTSPTAVPSPAWLNFAVTGKAKSGIRQYLKSQEKVESAELGRKLFEYALGEHKIDWKKIAKAKKQTFLRKLKLKTEKSLFETLGVGELSSLTVVRRLSEVLSGESAQDNDDSKANALAIVGSEGATLTYATCCRPIPGDDIRGVLGKSGMKVHVSNCRKLTKMDFSKNEDYMMFVSWSPNVKGVFIAEICVALKNVSGALAHLATAISDAGSSIHKIQTDEMDPAYGLVELLVEVQNRDHLATLLRRLKSMRMILRAHRVNHRI